MAKIEKAVQKFVKPYSNGSGSFWRVIVPDGRGGQLRRQGFLDKKSAIDFAADKYLKILSRVRGVASHIEHYTFKDYSLKWLEFKKRDGLAESSAMRYADDIQNKLIPYFGHFKLIDLEKHHLRNYIEDQQLQDVKSASLAYSVSVFKSILRQAEVDDLMPMKGITNIPTPRHKKAEPRFWDQKQIMFFLEAAKSHRHYDLWKLALFSGMRASEIAGLKWDCVHLDKNFGSYTGAIEIKRIYNQKTRRIEETTKNGDRRVVPLLPESKEVLSRLKASAKGEFVFGTNAPLDSSHFTRQLQSALKNLPLLPKISFHGLRHSFCSYLDATGMSRRIVSEIMGHRDLNTTNRYSHVSNQMLGLETQRWLNSQSQQKTSKLEVVSF